MGERLSGSGDIHKNLIINKLNPTFVAPIQRARSSAGARIRFRPAMKVAWGHVLCIQITNIIMKTNNIPIGQTGSLYESPALTALDIESEGLLCQSGGGNFDRADVGYGDNNMTEI